MRDEQKLSRLVSGSIGGAARKVRWMEVLWLRTACKDYQLRCLINKSPANAKGRAKLNGKFVPVNFDTVAVAHSVRERGRGRERERVPSFQFAPLSLCLCLLPLIHSHSVCV